MYNAQLFRFSGNDIKALPNQSAASEKKLRFILEKNLHSVFGITLLCREYPTGRTHRGFIDALGIDENGCPVIIEYKRKFNENIITQGLFYLDWLLDHKAEFTQIVATNLGEDAPQLEFGCTRLLCVASYFSRFDERAIMQINRNIELIKYDFYDDDLILLQTISNYASPFMADNEGKQQNASAPTPGMPVALQTRMNNMSQQTEQLYFSLVAFGEELGEDVSLKYLKHYIAMQTTRNFTCLQPAKTFIKLWLNLEPEEIPLEEGFSRNVRDVGHHASGNVEIDVHDMEDLEKAKPLIRLAYEKAGGNENGE